MLIFLWAQKCPKQVFLLASLDKDCPAFICITIAAWSYWAPRASYKPINAPSVTAWSGPGLLVDIAIDSRYNGENCFRPKPSGAWVGHILEPFNFIDGDVTLLWPAPRRHENYKLRTRNVGPHFPSAHYGFFSTRLTMIKRLECVFKRKFRTLFKMFHMAIYCYYVNFAWFPPLPICLT